MKKWIFAVLFALLALIIQPNDQAAANDFREVKAVNGSSLMVKSKMSTDAATLATLKRGDLVTVYSTQNGWSNIQAGNVKGYVKSNFLVAAKSTVKIASSKGGLVVKVAPSKSAKTVATLSQNMIVEDFGSVGSGWSFVQYGNVTGYVATSFIATAKTTTKQTTAATSLWNIASKSGMKVASLTANTKVEVHSTLKGWAYVTAGTKKGYMPAALLAALPNKPAASTTAKSVSIANYLPACPSVYEYRVTSDYTGVDYDTYTCKMESGGRYMEATFNADSFYSFQPNGDLYVAGAKADFVYKKTLSPGMTWTSDTYYNLERITYVVQSINETVTTPSGTYKNVVKIKETAPYFNRTVYLAPGYGEIKIVLDGNTVFELYSVKR